LAIFNDIDTGRATLNVGPTSGQVDGSILVEGARTISWGRGGKAQVKSQLVNVKAPFAIGGAAADSKSAVRYVVQQLIELSHNTSQQPIYIQWDSGDGILTPNPWDGWYRLDDVQPLDWSWPRHVPCQITATLVALGAPNNVWLPHAGGALSTDYSGAASNLLTLRGIAGSNFAWGTQNTFARTGAEGGLDNAQGTLPGPYPFTFSTTIANIFKGRVRVYDTINTSANPVPSAAGTYVNTNWVEVFDIDHQFVGDCVITNGLQLWLLVVGATKILEHYLWNTPVAAPGWLFTASLQYLDNSGTSSTLRQYGLIKIGWDEAVIETLNAVASTGHAAVSILKMQAGRYEGRVLFRPLTQATTSVNRLMWSVTSTPKIIYNPGKAQDHVVDGATGLAVQADYGYSATFIASASFPFVIGFLSQRKPGSQQGWSNGNANYGIGDGTSVPIGGETSYGFFASPYGVSASYSTASLQGEAESGSMDAGWTSQANAAASAGNEAKCASGTVTARKVLFGTIFSPAAGVYDVWFRVKVTSAAGASNEMLLGLHDETSGDNSQSTVYKPNQVTTSYAWYRVATDVTMPLAHASRLIAMTQATIGTDWFVD